MMAIREVAPFDALKSKSPPQCLICGEYDRATFVHLDHDDDEGGLARATYHVDCIEQLHRSTADARVKARAAQK
ncbi:MAG: hypothetical protein JO086_00125 [Acidimicrobiia bacterium]|nr:hypothetical protein [Acidimicrobiia bacterium]